MNKFTLALFLLSSTFLAAQNGGDTCLDAVAVTPGSFTDTTITQDIAGGEQGGLGSFDAAWFSFTPTEDGSIDISACADTVDTRLWVGTGACGALETVASDDDSCGANFQSVIEEFNVIGGTTYYIEWDDRWTGSAFDWTLTFEPTPACMKPGPITVSDITDMTALLTWSEVLTAINGYEWVVMADGEDPNDVGNTPISMGITDASSFTAVATGLMESTAYDAYVRSNCGADGLSEYSNISEFTTTCTIITPNYLETFDAGVVPPDCWTEASNGTPAEGPMNVGQGSWRADDYLNDSAASGGMPNAARINLFFNSEQDWLISPSFDLSNSTYELVYNVGVTANENQAAIVMGSDDQVQVLISTDNGASWTALLTYNAATTPSNLGQEEIINLSAFTGSAIFAFWASEGAINDAEDYDFFIDEFKVREPLNCTSPELTFTEIPDCDTNEYSVEITVTDLGTATSLLIEDDQGSATAMIDMVGQSVIYGPYASGQTLVFTITGDDPDCTVTRNFGYVCPPENDLCENAIALVNGVDFPEQALTVTNEDTTDSGVATPSCGNYDGGDLWFTAVVPENGQLILESGGVEGSLVVDTGLSVYTGMCDTLVEYACNDDIEDFVNFFSRVEIDDAALAGQTVYVRVWQWSNNFVGEFQVSAYSEAESCTPPDYELVVMDDCTNGTYTIDVNIATLGTSTEIVVTDDQGSDPQSITVDGGSATFGPFPVETEVTITLTGDNEDCTRSESAVSICPPSNDLCENALELIAGADFDARALQVTNSNATDSGASDPTCGNYNGGDLWFTATVPSDGILTIETGGVAGSTIIDTGVEAYTGTCDALVVIDCSDAIPNESLFSKIEINDVTLAGQTIYIRAWEWGNDVSDEFLISVYNEDILSVEDSQESQLSLYPNPTRDILNINNMPAFAKATITNILGQRVLESQTAQLQVSTLPAGIYFVTVQDGLNLSTLRFIKK